MSPEEAQALIGENPRNADVLFEYIERPRTFMQSSYAIGSTPLDHQLLRLVRREEPVSTPNASQSWRGRKSSPSGRNARRTASSSSGRLGQNCYWQFTLKQVPKAIPHDRTALAESALPANVASAHHACVACICRPTGQGDLTQTAPVVRVAYDDDFTFGCICRAKCFALSVGGYDYSPNVRGRRPGYAYRPMSSIRSRSATDTHDERCSTCRTDMLDAERSSRAPPTDQTRADRHTTGLVHDIRMTTQRRTSGGSAILHVELDLLPRRSDAYGWDDLGS